MKKTLIFSLFLSVLLLLGCVDNVTYPTLENTEKISCESTSRTCMSNATKAIGECKVSQIALDCNDYTMSITVKNNSDGCRIRYSIEKSTKNNMVGLNMDCTVPYEKITLTTEIVSSSMGLLKYCRGNLKNKINDWGASLRIELSGCPKNQNPYAAYVGDGFKCGYNETSNQAYCYSNNPSGEGTGINLKVYEIETYSNKLVCDKTAEYEGDSNYVFVSCDIPSTTKAYYYIGKEHLSDGTEIIQQN